MSKKGVSVISGSKSPVIGAKNIYTIVSWYPATAVSERDPAKVTWELFKKRSNGKFTTTNNKKSGRSDFTFGESAAGHTYRLEAYRYSPEGGGLIITPQPAKIPKINKVELFYIDDTKGTTFSFMEKLRARANCTNMLGKTLLFTLWEDDATGAGHNSKNLFVDSRSAKVNADGLAAVDFTLTQALMKKAAKGEMDSQLEFYVTVEYYKNKKHATQNINVKNPFPTKPAVKTPAVKANDTTVPKAPGSPAETKPNSQKEDKGILDTISDKLGELWDWAESKGTAVPEKPPTAPAPVKVSPAVVKDVPVKDNTCGEKYCIKIGDSSELIREINIRLAGFGGNIPTDQFTARTEKMVKQFQRDYMKIPENGKVCGNVLRSIDDFCSKWVEQISTYKCLCHASGSKVKVADRCSGYGKGKANEHPGEHRSLLWGVSALKFYLSQQKTYKYRTTSAGYRCWAHNNSVTRTSTNHMGKAVDIQFNENTYQIAGKADKNLKPLRNIRDQFYIKYLKAEEGWSIPSKTNNYRLEPIGMGKDQSYSWIHMDVALFEAAYLKDQFFTKKQESIIGKSIIILANELGYKEVCNCGGAASVQPKPVETSTCLCFKEGKVKTACAGKGSLISSDVYKKESERVGVETAMMMSIAKQESKKESFYKEGQATILFERHKMWQYLKKDLKKSVAELNKLKLADPAIVNDISGGYGKFSAQYEKLEKAKKIDYNTALKSCSWGKFQVMGFNYKVAFSSPKEMEKAVNLCEIQQFYFFIGYLEKTEGIITAMKNKNWEVIAAKYNGSKWKTKNPDYATNIEKFYKEFKK